ncbi:MAG: ImmA/IrrE family metallo-endopeptidase [Acidobacteria bacterium]|nr:ImmA/IrrE family metallo-endopeptidase [Acidobacteriota bacterium]
MKHLPTLFTQYGIGERPLNEDDVLKIYDDLHITILESSDGVFTFTMLGRTFVALPKRRKGLKRLHSLLHELGHILLMNGKEPSVAFQTLRYCDHDKAEAEAEAIALMALIPKNLIEESAYEFGLTRYGDRLWRERCRLYFLYDI